jgi:hypothetical protein
VSAERTSQRAARPGVDLLAGLFGAIALFCGLVAIVYHPIAFAVAAALLALVSAGMSPRHQTLAAIALVVTAVGFVAGLAIAVITKNPLW